MLRKLTSPKPNAQQVSETNESSASKARASSADQRNETKRVADGSETPPASTDDEAKAAPTSDELKLDLQALNLSSDATSDQVEHRRILARSPRVRKNLLAVGADAAGTATADAPSDRQQPLARSPRVRKDLVSDSVSEPAVKDDAPVDRQQTLARSPRVRKNLLDNDESDATTGANSQTMKASPKKRGGGLRALRADVAKPTRAPREATSSTKGDKSRTASSKKASADDNSRHSKRNDDSTEVKNHRVKMTQRTPDRAEAKTPNEQDNDDNVESEAERKSQARPLPTSSLSPLRRRPAMNDEASRSGLSSQRTGGHLQQRLQLRDLPPLHQPEVHVIGEITSGEGFGSGGFACKWGLEYGRAWQHIAGDQLGQTQVDYPASSTAPIIVWSHPLDLHFATTSFHGWPKLLLQVWHVDAHMKANVVGYGFVTLPFAAGEHELTASLWRPMGSTKEELAAALLGRTPELVSDDVVFRAAWADRCRLQTLATGKVRLRLGILLRNFQGSANLQM